MFKNGFKMVRSGFTLAEVLITLGIIGVVAAMTMPTLMNATNGAQYRTAYKKALSVISQAIVLNLALEDYDLDTRVTGIGDGSIYHLFETRMNTAGTADGAISDYFAALGEKADSQDEPQAVIGDSNYTFFFNDGIMFTFPKNAKNCTKNNVEDDDADAPSTNVCYGFIDVNGKKGPNVQTTCDNDVTEDDGCVVTNPQDIYPVKFYDQGIYPATAAGRAVLYKK